MRKLTVLTAVAIVISYCHLISAYSFDSFEDDNVPARPWNRRATLFNIPFPFYNVWQGFGRGSRYNIFNIDDMVHDIMDGINNPMKIKLLGDDFDDSLSRSISETIEKNMDEAKDLQEKIVFETKKMQEKTNKEQEFLLEGKNGKTLVVIEGKDSNKQYVVKKGIWHTCKETLSTTEEPNCPSELEECKPDICAYNSIIKYRLKNRDKSEYKEPDVVCLIKGYANSVKQFSGVSEKTVKETCVKGDILPLSEYNEKCGVEEKLRYFYWPSQDSPKKCPGGCCTQTINWKVQAQGVSHSSSSGGNESSSSSSSSDSSDNSFSVVSSSLSSFVKK